MNWQSLDDILKQLERPVDELAGDIWVKPQHVATFIENSIDGRFSNIKWSTSKWTDAAIEMTSPDLDEVKFAPGFARLISMLKDEAATSPWYDKFIDILVSTMDINALWLFESPLIYYAVQCKWSVDDPKLIIEILNAGANPNLIASWETALHLAIKNWCEKIALELVKAGANPAIYDSRWNSCFSLANGKQNLFNILKSSKILAFNRQNLCDILEAKWFESWSANIVSEDDIEAQLYWESWIYWFANKDEEIIKAFIACWANLNFKNDKEFTPLMNAAKAWKSKIVSELLLAWADKSLLDEQWKTALLHAKLAWHDDIVNMLRKNPVTDDFLIYLESKWMSDMADVLRVDRDIDAFSELGNTLLIFAAIEWNLNLLNECKKFWADFNLRNGNWRTALSYAVAKEHIDAIEFLLDNWADPNQVMSFWETRNTPGVKVRECTCLDFTTNQMIIRLIKNHKSYKRKWFLGKIFNLLSS
ncbi:MAG: Pfs, NACHT and Ankyrin protein [uncultured bacterium (gcode 4)]|uniref:Pfs, NACHT and Ankyrin protein n=1 Tax=uncultured bacterium (gcode 4) TaxID=1234023 RepID=K2G4N5_9BACT|nr:MAG: Pfs, NACHT and Ankyrin protein [uncultured bacterium (gcode 4)]